MILLIFNSNKYKHIILLQRQRQRDLTIIFPRRRTDSSLRPPRGPGGQPGPAGVVLLAGLPHSGGEAAGWEGGRGRDQRLHWRTSRGAAWEDISSQVFRQSILGEYSLLPTEVRSELGEIMTLLHYISWQTRLRATAVYLGPALAHKLGSFWEFLFLGIDR